MGLGLATWQVLFGVVAVGGTAFGGYKYIRQRRDELAWRRAEFLLRLGETFDAQPAYVDAIALLHVDRADPSDEDLEAILTGQSKDVAGLTVRDSVDRLFDFFDRIAHFVEEGVLTTKDVSLFGWYLRRLCAIQPLKEFGQQYYKHVLELQKKLEDKREDKPKWWKRGT